MSNHTKTVKDGYNKIADTYLLERVKLRTERYVKMFVETLAFASTVLDVGCGAGTPVDDYLMKKGHGVVGIDISEEQIRRARKLVKGGDYCVRDINTLTVGEYIVDGIVCLYTMFHIKREKQEEVIRKFASYLPKNGTLLISMGDKEFEGEHMMFGTPMWSSQYGSEKNISLIKRAGFEIIMEELNTTGSEKHQIILARKT